MMSYVKAEWLGWKMVTQKIRLQTLETVILPKKEKGICNVIKLRILTCGDYSDGP